VPLIGIFFLLFLFGFVRYDFVKTEFVEEKEILLVSKITSEPKETEKIKSFKINDVLVITDKYSDYQYGDKIKAVGILTKGPLLFFPEIEKIESGKGFYKIILSFKDKLREVINRSFSPPKSSVFSAMTIGDKHKMDNNLKEKLNISGTRHITAISGMHIALIGTFLIIFFMGIGLSRSLSFYFSILFLIFFVAMIGFPSSGVRAAIMGGVYMISKVNGRMNTASRNLFLTGAFMLLFNPLLIHDYGFNLSFLAVFGIIYFSPVLKENISFLKNSKNTEDAFFIALSAYVFTFPFILYNFHEVSLIAVLTNIIIIPFVYLIMVFGFLFLIFGIIFPLISFVFFIPLSLFLSIFLFIIDFFSLFPYLKIENIHFTVPLLMYLFLFILLYKFNKKSRYGRI